MLAAIVGEGSSATALRDRLREFGRAAGLTRPSELITDFGGAMVWAGPGLAGVDQHAGCAWTGEVRGPLPTPPDEDFSELVGDFGLVALRSSRAVLVRSRFGGRPLYYARDSSGSVLVCSRLAPLVSMLARPLHVDPRRLAAVILTTTHADFHRTVYESVSRVPSGDALVVSPLETRVRSRRALPARPSVRTSAEAAEELRARLLRTVSRVTQGARRVAVCVSGGVDSSAVLGAAVAVARGASRREAELVALSLDFGGIGDDRPHLDALSRSLGIVPVRMAARDFVAPGPRTTVIDGAPFPWPTGDAHIRLLRRARTLGADVVLTGEMGDDIFGGDLRVFGAMAHAGRPLQGLRGALSLKGTWLHSPLERISAFFLRPLAGRILGPMPIGMRRATRVHYSWAGPVLREIRDAAGSRNERTETADILSGRARQRALDGPLYHLDVSDTRGQYEVIAGCRLVYVPLDEEIADFTASLPASFLFHGGFHRGLLREASKGLVPDSVRLRCDNAAAFALLEALFDAPGCAEAIEPLLSMRALADLGLVEPKRFAASLHGFPRIFDAKTRWMGLWPAVVAESFARRVLSGGGWPAEASEEGFVQ